MNNNYYLNLLYKKTMELKAVLQKMENGNYSPEYKKYLISGYIIILDSILEIGISDLHSSDIDSLTSLIYYSRQKAVHYGYFNGLSNMEEIANEIIAEVEKHHEKEQEFYANLFDSKNFHEDLNNVVIKDSTNISTDGFFFKFKSKDGLQEVLVPTKKIFTLTKKNKEKVSSYIIDTSESLSMYKYKDGHPSAYEEISPQKAKEFFKNNFFVDAEDYKKHNEAIADIIYKFVSDPINSIQIMEYASNEQFCRNTVDVIKEFILERSLYEAYIDNHHLIKDKYSLSKMQRTDFSKIQQIFKKNITKHLNEKDLFFIEMTSKRFKYYNDILGYDFLDTADPELISTILIQLYETGPKHFSDDFISSSPEFKKCYQTLTKYRQIFSHYLLSNKDYKETLEKFKYEFVNFIKLLDYINLDEVQTPIKENYESFNLIERDKSDFFNYKHEQFLKFDSKTYIGKKIFYSSKNPKSSTLYAVLPSGNHASNLLYYERDAFAFLKPVQIIDEYSGKKSYKHVSKFELPGAKEVKFDFNMSNLFKAYAELKKKKSNADIQIFFAASKENGNYAHYDSLENVIFRYFSQGYIPIELMKKTKINLSSSNQGVITLLDEKGGVIANIVNVKKKSMNNTGAKDNKRFFSRIDDINHNFSKRRHSK